MERGGGQVVSMLSFFFSNPNSNLLGYFLFQHLVTLMFPCAVPCMDCIFCCSILFVQQIITRFHYSQQKAF